MLLGLEIFYGGRVLAEAVSQLANASLEPAWEAAHWGSFTSSFSCTCINAKPWYLVIARAI